MSDAVSANQLSAYLDSVRSLYPCGIALDAIQALPDSNLATTYELHGTNSSRLMFFHLLGADPAAERELLHAAISKGLKLKLAEVGIVEFQAGMDDAAVQSLLALFEGAPQKIAVVLGVAAARQLGLLSSNEASLERGWSSLRGARAICTHSVADVLKIPARKREFWEDLQLVLEELK